MTGIAKGAGMIRPNMATMLGFVATDAAVAPALLQQLVKTSADVSFNCVTVDGDTSTNDSFMLIATGARAMPASTARIRNAALRRCRHRRVAHARAGDRARRRGRDQVHHRTVERGRSEAECRKVAYAIAHSPLVKTAFFASDPNLGRILAAIGYAGVEDLDTGRVDLYLDDVLVARGRRAQPVLP